MSPQNNRNDNGLETAAIAALAATTKTPFKTAFKITVGIALAQMAIGLAFLGTLGVGIAVLVWLVRK